MKITFLGILAIAAVAMAVIGIYKQRNRQIGTGPSNGI
jgi:hypothetical protein